MEVETKIGIITGYNTLSTIRLFIVFIIACFIHTIMLFTN